MIKYKSLRFRIEIRTPMIQTSTLPARVVTYKVPGTPFQKNKKALKIVYGRNNPTSSKKLLYGNQVVIPTHPTNSH